MVLFRHRPPSALEERLKAIEREKRALRDRVAALESLPDPVHPGPSAPRLRGPAMPRAREAAAAVERRRGVVPKCVALLIFMTE